MPHDLRTNMFDGVPVAQRPFTTGTALVDNYHYFTIYQTPGAWTYLYLNGQGGSAGSQNVTAESGVASGVPCAPKPSNYYIGGGRYPVAQP